MLVLLLGTQRVLHRLDVPLLGAGVARAAALMLALRRVGLVLLALAFFLFWTLIYIGVWRSHPEGAFRGLPGTPTFSDFFYYSVSTGFISPPGDITAASKGARTATMIELLTGTAALAAYLGSFLDFGTRGRGRRRGRRGPVPGEPARLELRDLAGVVDADVDLALHRPRARPRACRRAPCSCARCPCPAAS